MSQRYYQRMRESMPDKVFFLDKIPGAKTIVDYGCADGTLIALAREFIHPDIMCVGVDTNLKAIQKARARNLKRCKFFLADQTKDYNPGTSFLRDVDKLPRPQAYLFLSVLHEEAILPRLSLGPNGIYFTPQYIVIRDMCYEGPFDINPQEFKFPKDKADQMDFTIRGNRRGRTVQQLLKSMYFDNWEHEVKEDYFSVNWEYIVDFYYQQGYYVLYDHKYVLPYVQLYAEKFNIDLVANGVTTHRQLILRKR